MNASLHQSGRGVGPGGWISAMAPRMGEGCMRSSARVVVALGVLSFLSACPAPSVVECRVGADCASGVCLGDGTCGPAAAVDGGGDAGNGHDAGGLTDGGVVGEDGGALPDAGPVDSGTPVGCLPNNDGVITRDEVITAPGLHATFKVSGASVAFTTAGSALTDGGLNWDFTTALSGDASTLVETQAITGQVVRGRLHGRLVRRADGHRLPGRLPEHG